MSEKAVQPRRLKRHMARNDRALHDPARYSGQCRGKVRFSSKRAASGVARVVGNTGVKMHAYRCPACRYWHNGGGRPRGRA